MKDIILKDHNAADFDLLKYQGKNFLIVIFYRGYWCNICRAQLQDFNKNLKKFKKARIVAISGDEPLYASLLSTHIKAKFPILPDPKMVAFKAFDLKTPKNKKEILPAIFIVSPAGQIIYTSISKNPEERPEIKEIVCAIDIK
jgi:peroxiredoxin